MDQTKQKEEYGYDLFPERNAEKFKKGSIGQSMFTFNHKCQVMLQFAMETSEYPASTLTLLKQTSFYQWLLIYVHITVNLKFDFIHAHA